MNKTGKLSGRSFGVYIADPIVAGAWETAGLNDGTSKYGAAAVIEKLKNDGYLPETDAERSDLEIVREARELGVNVNDTLAIAIAKCNIERVTCHN